MFYISQQGIQSLPTTKLLVPFFNGMTKREKQYLKPNKKPYGYREFAFNEGLSFLKFDYIKRSVRKGFVEMFSTPADPEGNSEFDIWRNKPEEANIDYGVDAVKVNPTSGPAVTVYFSCTDPFKKQ